MVNKGHYERFAFQAMFTSEWLFKEYHSKVLCFPFMDDKTII